MAGKDGVIYFLKSTVTKDVYGVEHESFEHREVFCQVFSITRTEFFSAGRNGLNPDFMFKVFSGDYEEERTCKYEGVSYAIYRTYNPPGEDYIELYAQTEGGANGKGNTGQLQSADTSDT